ncbi:MAG: DMT family transporter [Microbacteriaceae bacterium]|jgi:drug/metabolite transporter (DMT)-like permease|nr:DMT family transporter [Microbacteriaceae bacterium]
MAMGLLALVLTNLFWSGNYIFGHLAVATMTPIELTFFRWTLAAVPLLLMGWFLERPDWRAVLRAIPRLCVLSACGLAGYNVLLYWALQLTSPFNATLVGSISPLLIAVGGATFLHQRMSRLDVLGILAGLLGVVIVLTHGAVWQILSLHLGLGDVLILVTTVMWVVYTLLARWVSEIPPITATGMEAALGSIILAPFAVATQAKWPEDPQALWSLLFIVALPSVVSFALWNLTVPKVGPALAGASINLMPVFTAAAQVAMGTPLLWSQIIGGAIVVIGVLLTAMPAAPHPLQALRAHPRR